ncbi:MAG: flagellar export protein FliJ [Chromatiaceae bacterium]|nr:flagellar export protein FliJ [Chromatiaceae bacterium]
MAPPSDRFKPIQKIALHKERKAAAALGESLKTREAAVQRLDELRQYLAEYQERFARAARNGLSSSQILEYQVFISKLETAIEQQEGNVARTQKNRFERGSLAWPRHQVEGDGQRGRTHGRRGASVGRQKGAVGQRRTRATQTLNRRKSRRR